MSGVRAIRIGSWAELAAARKPTYRATSIREKKRFIAVNPVIIEISE